MRKLSKSKAQFFIIAAALVIAYISMTTFYLQSLFYPTATSLSLHNEMEYIEQVENVLCRFYKSEKEVDEQMFLKNLEEMEQKLKTYFAEQGILFSMRYKKSGGKILFWFNLTSSGFKSESFVECA